ncbi:MAG: hypothetical protein GY782_09215 [Gammaproteobacteria bacterium]|nr:hypothetical protein [Gammaproteobacteria bacterium]
MQAAFEKARDNVLFKGSALDTIQTVAINTLRQAEANEARLVQQVSSLQTDLKGMTVARDSYEEEYPLQIYLQAQFTSALQMMLFLWYLQEIPFHMLLLFYQESICKY